MKMLLAGGARMRVNSIGETLLHTAIKRGCVEGARLLVDAGHCLHAIYTTHPPKEDVWVWSWSDFFKHAIEKEKVDEKQWQWLMEAVSKQPELAADTSEKCERCGFDSSMEGVTRWIEQLTHAVKRIKRAPRCANPGTHTHAHTYIHFHAQTQLASRSTQSVRQLATGANTLRLRV